VEAGNVRCVAGEWVRAWLDELRAFPTGKHDDQVDASSGAFTEVARGGGFVARV
jgi:predicted phage terminase large subunit-like protein